MSDTYTPSEDVARSAYVAGMKEILSRGGYASNSKTLGAEFDRFVARIKAEAWDEGHTEGSVTLGIAILHGKGYEGPSNPYREEQGVG